MTLPPTSHKTTLGAGPPLVLLGLVCALLASAALGCDMAGIPAPGTDAATGADGGTPGERVCIPDARWCLAGALRMCSADGTEYTEATCPSGMAGRRSSSAGASSS